MEYEKTASLSIIRNLLLLIGFVFLMFVFSDYYYYGKGSVFYISLGLRGIGLVMIFTTVAIIKKFRRYEHILIVSTVAQLLLVFLYLVNLYILRGAQVDIQFMTVVLFIIAFFLIPNKWLNSVIGACFVLGSYSFFSVLTETGTPLLSLFLRWVYLGIVLIACTIFLFGREKSRRRQYASERLMEFMSITDRLTGIYNRGRFESVLGQWIKSSRHNPFCLILFDIDDFKKVNDRFGHAAGDNVLVSTTETITARIRADDIFARWGGEEFVVLFSQTGIAQAADLAERLRTAVEKNSFNEREHVTISIGVVEYHEGESIKDFINRADEKMYEAKKAGKNQIMVESADSAGQ